MGAPRRQRVSRDGDRRGAERRFPSEPPLPDLAVAGMIAPPVCERRLRAVEAERVVFGQGEM
jgi:hypothetical protein